MACTSNEKWLTSYNNNVQCSNVDAEFCLTWGHISYRQESHETIRTIVGVGGYEGEFLGCAAQQCCECGRFFNDEKACYDHIVPPSVVKEVGNLTDVDFHYIKPGQACADFDMVGASRNQCQHVASTMNDGGHNNITDDGAESYCIKWDNDFSTFYFTYLPPHSRFCPHGADSCLCVAPKDIELIMDKVYPTEIERKRNAANPNSNLDPGKTGLSSLEITLIMISSLVGALLLVCILITFGVKHNSDSTSDFSAESTSKVRKSAFTQLQMLHDLKEKNMIDDERFEKQKCQLLSVLDTTVLAEEREDGRIGECEEVEEEKEEVQSVEEEKEEIQKAEEEKEEIRKPSSWRWR